MLHYQLISDDNSLSNRPCIVLMHGLFGESGNLLNIAKALHHELDLPVLLPDMLNHGRSAHQLPMSYPVMADSVEQLLDYLHLHLDLDTHLTILLGHSMGGKVAMQMASNKPHHYKAVIVADIAPVDYALIHRPIIEVMQEVEQALRAGWISQRREADKLLAKVVPQASLRQFLLKNLKRSPEKKWGWQFGLNEIAESYPELAKAPSFDLSAGHACSDAPLLIIKGANSDYIQPDAQAAFAQRFSQIELKIINGAGHWLHADKPQLFINIVLRFTRKIL